MESTDSPLCKATSPSLFVWCLTSRQHKWVIFRLAAKGRNPALEVMDSEWELTRAFTTQTKITKHKFARCKIPPQTVVKTSNYCPVHWTLGQHLSFSNYASAIDTSAPSPHGIGILKYHIIGKMRERFKQQIKHNLNSTKQKDLTHLSISL